MEINEIILKYGQRVDTLNGVKCDPIQNFSYETVKVTLPTLLMNGDYIAIVKLLLNITVKENQELIYFILWVQDELKLINEREHKTLSSEPDPKLIAAGINKLNMFKHFGSIRSLTSCLTRQQEYSKYSYELVYTNLLYNKTFGDIQTAYQKNTK